MAISGYYIDDSEDEARTYSDLVSIETGEGLYIKPYGMDKAYNLVEAFFEEGIEVLILDFRLDDNPDAITPEDSYKATSLAQMIREKSITSPEKDFPIFLFSAEDKKKLFNKESTAHDLFDKTYTKEFVTEQADSVGKEILSIANGYRKLRGVLGGDWESIFRLKEGENEVIDHQLLRTTLGEENAPHLASSFILKYIICRSGLLIADHEASALLGVRYMSDELAAVLEKAGLRYTGIFSDGWRRWWRHRFEDWSVEFFGKRPTQMLGKERVEQLQAKAGITVVPALSPWTGSSEEKFAFSCASCDRPTEIRHSVSAFDPDLPSFGRQRRICWDCIQLEQYKAKGLKVDDVDRDLAEEVLIMER